MSDGDGFDDVNNKDVHASRDNSESEEDMENQTNKRKRYVLVYELVGILLINDTYNQIQLVSVINFIYNLSVISIRLQFNLTLINIIYNYI